MLSKEEKAKTVKYSISVTNNLNRQSYLELSLEMMLSDERAQKSDRYLALTKTPSEQTKTSSLVLLRRTTSESTIL